MSRDISCDIHHYCNMLNILAHYFVIDKITTLTFGITRETNRSLQGETQEFVWPPQHLASTDKAVACDEFGGACCISYCRERCLCALVYDATIADKAAVFDELEMGTGCANVLTNSCLFAHPADKEQYMHSFGVVSLINRPLLVQYSLSFSSVFGLHRFLKEIYSMSL